MNWIGRRIVSKYNWAGCMWMWLQSDCIFHFKSFDVQYENKRMKLGYQPTDQSGSNPYEKKIAMAALHLIVISNQHKCQAKMTFLVWQIFIHPFELDIITEISKMWAISCCYKQNIRLHYFNSISVLFCSFLCAFPVIGFQSGPFKRGSFFCHRHFHHHSLKNAYCANTWPPQSTLWRLIQNHTEIQKYFRSFPFSYHQLLSFVLLRCVCECIPNGDLKSYIIYIVKTSWYSCTIAIQTFVYNIVH